jgi:hypothetical protein
LPLIVATFACLVGFCAADAQERQIVSDKSLSVGDYISQGVPSHDRDWIGADMATAAKALQQIAARDGRQLPRFGSENSGKLFARIVHIDNLKFYKNETLPLGQRLIDCLTYFDGLNTINKMYIHAFLQKQTTSRELIEGATACVRTTEVMAKLAGQFVETLDKTDPLYASRMQGLEGIKKSVATIVAGSLQTLTESACSTTDHKILIRQLVAPPQT